MYKWAHLSETAALFGMCTKDLKVFSNSIGGRSNLTCARFAETMYTTEMGAHAENDGQI